MVWPWATALYGLVLSTRVPDAECGGEHTSPLALVQTRNFRFFTSSFIHGSPNHIQAFHAARNISVFTARICPSRRLENSLQNGLVLFFLYTVYDRGLWHIFIYISCFNTFKKKRGKYVDCEWKALLTLATWGESLHSAKTRHLCRNVLSLLKHLSKPAHLSPLALVSLYAVDFVNESADRWCHALISVCVWMCVCVWLLTRAIYICILLLLLATGSGSKHLLTSLSYLAVLQHIT